MTHQPATPKRRGRPAKAAASAVQATEATDVAAAGQKAVHGHTEALVSEDTAMIMAHQLHTWLGSLARGARHV
jgi:hypothetical protein